MASRVLPQQSFLHLFQPVQHIRQPLLSNPFLRRILSPSIPASLPLAAFAGVADILREIWDGLLRAVPKKKTSHMKKRHRQMAGKAIKDVTHLSKCSACGRLKRAHVLCPYCVVAVKAFVKEKVLAPMGWKIPQAAPRLPTTYNAAETAPGAWEAIQAKLKKKAKEKREREENDKTKW